MDALLEWLRLPGTTATAWLGGTAPALADWLGLGPEGANQATIATTIAALSWILLVLLIGYLIECTRNVDRQLTSYVSGRYAEGRRLLRVLRRRIQSTIGQMRQRAREPDIAVAAVELGQLEAAVLRCYGSAGELRTLASDEIASRLRISLKQVEIVIRRLMENQLVERAFATDEGRHTHRITRAGQIFLIER